MDYTLTGTIQIAPALSGLLRATVEFFGGSIVRSTVVVSGTLKVTRLPVNNAEGRRAALGYRPIMPLLVYHAEVDDILDIDATIIPNNGCFLMAAHYLPVALDGMYDNGAIANSIGMRAEVDGNIVLIFREPEDGEIVWSVTQTGSTGLFDLTLDELFALTLDELFALPLGQTITSQIDNGLLRWSGRSWVQYKSIPERAVEGMQVFKATDPDEVYLYYARLIGAALQMTLADSRSLLDLLEPNACPTDLLEPLSEQVGMPILEEADAAQRLRLAQTAIDRAKLAGQNAGVSLILSILGYSGYATEVWVDPIAVANWEAYPGAPAAIKADILARGLTEDDIDPESGWKGQDYFEAPHAYFNTAPTGYHLSSRVNVHVGYADGAALDFEMGQASANALKQLIAKFLRIEILPAHVDIRQFVTDEEIDDDVVNVGDGMVLTEV